MGGSCGALELELDDARGERASLLYTAFNCAVAFWGKKVSGLILDWIGGNCGACGLEAARSIVSGQELNRNCQLLV